jgi:hypothetical protein
MPMLHTHEHVCHVTDQSSTARDEASSRTCTRRPSRWKCPVHTPRDRLAQYNRQQHTDAAHIGRTWLPQVLYEYISGEPS